MAKKRILAIGFDVPCTGLTRVMRTILSGLQDRYEIHWIGIGYRGPIQEHGFKVYPCNLEGGDLYGSAQCLERNKQLKPDILFLVNDIWILSTLQSVIPRLDPRPKIVCYTPLDGTIADLSIVAPLSGFDRWVVYTEFARGNVSRAMGQWSQQNPSFEPPPLEVISHGVDTRQFYPLGGTVERRWNLKFRAQIRRQMFPDHRDMETAFLVLNANRYQPRKRIDQTIQGFAKFAADKPESVRLILHHAILNHDQRDEILTMAKDCGMEQRLHLSDSSAGNRRMSDDRLNLLFNACDVGLNNSMGEGFGLLSFEHAATGAAQIVPRHSACAELWQDAAEFLEPVETLPPQQGVPLCLQPVSVDGIATALERLYESQELYRHRCHTAYERATEPRFQWTEIAEQWDCVFRDVLS